MLWRRLELFWQRAQERGASLRFLAPFAWFYGLGVCLRNFLYDRGWLSMHRVSIPVWSVGNLVVGGTGKTPVVLLLAQALAKKHTVAILSRGYRSPAERGAGQVLSQGEGPRFSSRECGDEPYLLARRLPHVHVYVGRDRVRNARKAVSNGVGCLILDDGMQHRRLVRDEEVVVIDARRPLGGGAFFPQGLLREMPQALQRATLLVLNHLRNQAHFDEVCLLLQRYSTAPVVGLAVEGYRYFSLDGKELCLAPRSAVGAFCGLGSPLQFFESVERQGFSLAGTLRFPDHGTEDGEFLASFAQQCQKRGAQYLVCTEKDALHLDSSREYALPLVWVEQNVQIKYNYDVWQSVLGNSDN